MLSSSQRSLALGLAGQPSQRQPQLPEEPAGAAAPSLGPLETAFAQAALAPHLLEPLGSSTPALALAGSASAESAAAADAAAAAAASALAAARSLSVPALPTASLLHSRLSDAASDAVGAAAATATALAAALSSHRPCPYKPFGLCGVEWDVLKVRGWQLRVPALRRTCGAAALAMHAALGTPGRLGQLAELLFFTARSAGAGQLVDKQRPAAAAAAA